MEISTGIFEVFLSQASEYFFSMHESYYSNGFLSSHNLCCVAAVTLFAVVLGDSVKEIYFSLHRTPGSEDVWVVTVGRIYVTAFIVIFIFIILNIATLIVEVRHASRCH